MMHMNLREISSLECGKVTDLRILWYLDAVGFFWLKHTVIAMAALYRHSTKNICNIGT